MRAKFQQIDQRWRLHRLEPYWKPGLHHHALDRGAVGLAASGSRGFKLLDSQELSGTSESLRQLVDAPSRPIRKPQEHAQLPDPGFVDWHRREVFRGEPRTS